MDVYDYDIDWKRRTTQTKHVMEAGKRVKTPRKVRGK